MFQKVLELRGRVPEDHLCSPWLVMLIGIVMNVLPFFFLYQLHAAPADWGKSLEHWIRSLAGGGHRRLRGPVRLLVCEGPVPLPPGGLQHPEKPAAPPSRESWSGSPWA